MLEEAWLSVFVLFIPEESANGFKSNVFSKLNARSFYLNMILGMISAIRNLVLLKVAFLTISCLTLTFVSSSEVTCVKFLIKHSFIWACKDPAYCESTPLFFY